MYSTIIVPIDIANMERAPAMIAAARTLGPEARIVLVYAVEALPSHIMAEVPVDILPQTRERAEKLLTGLAADVGADAEVKVTDGHAASAILDLADELKADAIVIASHKPGWTDYLIGSTAARVVRHAKCSVLVLR
ncbi:MAG: universal stress protein [Nitratireductor sp.]|nr:universal stress protein [Nitratireductor sp.]